MDFGADGAIMVLAVNIVEVDFKKEHAHVIIQNMADAHVMEPQPNNASAIHILAELMETGQHTDRTDHVLLNAEVAFKNDSVIVTTRLLLTVEVIVQGSQNMSVSVT